MIIIKDGSLPKVLTGEKTQITRYLSENLRVIDNNLYPGRFHVALVKSGSIYRVRAARTFQATLIAPSGRLVPNPVEEVESWRYTDLKLENWQAAAYLLEQGYKPLLVKVLSIVTCDARTVDWRKEGFETSFDFLATFKRWRKREAKFDDFSAYTISFEYLG